MGSTAFVARFLGPVVMAISMGVSATLQLSSPRPSRTRESSGCGRSRDIEKAGKADCRNALAGAGVLAVVPLVADAVKGSGCKW